MGEDGRAVLAPGEWSALQEQLSALLQLWRGDMRIVLRAIERLEQQMADLAPLPAPSPEAAMLAQVAQLAPAVEAWGDLPGSDQADRDLYAALAPVVRACARWVDAAALGGAPPGKGESDGRAG